MSQPSLGFVGGADGPVTVFVSGGGTALLVYLAQYLVPQECGAKTAVRWAKVVDRKGRGLLFTADAAKPMFFSALPYTPHEMESAKHPYELPPVHYTVIRAIGEQMGVGGDDSWGANVHPEYIPDVTKPVEFTFTFRGI